jgi:hypothetical protein
MIELPLSCATVPQIIQLGFSDCNEIEKPAQHLCGNSWRCHFAPECRQVTFNISDTLIKIANQFGVTVKAIRTENKLTTDRIKVGQHLKIPVKAGAAAPAATPEPAAGTTPSGSR